LNQEFQKNLARELIPQAVAQAVAMDVAKETKDVVPLLRQKSTNWNVGKL
jgi:hypothetical protein